MKKKKLYCLVRNLDDPSQSAGAVGIEYLDALDRIKKGFYGKNWQLEECVDNPIGSAPLLRVIARSLPNGGIEIVWDNDFERYFEGGKTPIPESEILGPILNCMK